MEVTANATHPDMSPKEPAAGQPVYYVLTALVLVSLIGCLVGMVLYFRRRARLDELRHRLLPLYTYDPAEQDEDWEDDGREEEERLAESLLKDRQLIYTKETPESEESIAFLKTL